MKHLSLIFLINTLAMTGLENTTHSPTMSKTPVDSQAMSKTLAKITKEVYKQYSREIFGGIKSTSGMKSLSYKLKSIKASVSEFLNPTSLQELRLDHIKEILDQNVYLINIDLDKIANHQYRNIIQIIRGVELSSIDDFKTGYNQYDTQKMLKHIHDMMETLKNNSNINTEVRRAIRLNMVRICTFCYKELNEDQKSFLKSETEALTNEEVIKLFRNDRNNPRVIRSRSSDFSIIEYMTIKQIEALMKVVDSNTSDFRQSIRVNLSVYTKEASKLDQKKLKTIFKSLLLDKQKLQKELTQIQNQISKAEGKGIPKDLLLTQERLGDKISDYNLMTLQLDNNNIVKDITEKIEAEINK